ncbi:MAG: histidine kinase [Bacteroidales bacterium]|nr:histidine kinase [Bacteroidales bacterium]
MYLLKVISIWLGIGIFLFVPTSYFFPIEYAVLSSGSISLVLVIVILINDKWLFPKFFISNRKRFVFYNLIVVFVFSGLYLLLDIYTTPRKLFDGTEKLPFIFPILRALTSVFFVDFISITILLSNVLKENAEREKQLKEEKLGTELKLLKAQINPHFIFNALNNIYSLAYTKSELAPESILKLSEMLRYVFCDCSSDDVKLNAEIEYIRNFIAFQQIKSEHTQNINFNYSDAKKNVDIAPMIFIPFIENAFKYSKVEEIKDAYVDVNLSCQDKSIKFKIENSIPSKRKIKSGSGMGIKNVRQRLDLLYLDKYYLKIDESDVKFVVELGININ